jgi:hypothetical protein
MSLKIKYQNSIVIILISLFWISCNKKPDPINPIGSFSIKGTLIDSCTGLSLKNKIPLALNYMEDYGLKNELTQSDTNGNFILKCKLYYDEIRYFLNVVPGQNSNDLKIKPKDGEIIDLGKLNAGYKAYLNVKFIFTNVNPTDTLYMGSSAEKPLMVTYPITASKVVNYGYESYQVTLIKPILKQNTWYWGVGKLAYSNAIATQSNKVIAREVLCSSADTTFVNIP